MTEPRRTVGRRTLTALMIGTIAVPVVFGLLSLLLSNPSYIIGAALPTIVLGTLWYAAESGHRKSVHPSRTHGGTAHPIPEDQR